MKRTLIFSFAAAGLVWMSGCGNTDQTADKDENLISFKSYTASATYDLVGSAADYHQDTDVTCTDSVSLLMPVIINGVDVEVLRDSIMSRVLNVRGVSVEDAIKQYLKTSAEFFECRTRPSAKPGSQADGYTTVIGSIAYLTPELLVYCITTSVYYPGAANGDTVLDYINYSTGKNAIITLEDMFTPEGLKRLPERIAEQAESNPEYAGQLMITELPASKTFFLSSEGEIVFSYAPMEVGPHVLGNVQIPFYPYELEELMTSEAKALFHLDTEM